MVGIMSTPVGTDFVSVRHATYTAVKELADRHEVSPYTQVLLLLSKTPLAVFWTASVCFLTCLPSPFLRFFCENAEKVAEKFGGFRKTLYLCTRKNGIKPVEAKDRGLAQLVAHTSGGREVAGSSPVAPTKAERLKIEWFSASLFVCIYRLSDDELRRVAAALPLPGYDVETAGQTGHAGTVLSAEAE